MGGKFRWPSVKEVAEYRLKVRNFLIQVIDRTPLQLPVTPESPWVSSQLLIRFYPTPQHVNP